MIYIALRRSIEIRLTWKVGFVMAVVPGMNFIYKTISVVPCPGDYEMVSESVYSHIDKWMTGTCLQEGVAKGRSMGCAFPL